MSTVEKIQRLTRQLLPTGRAFKMPEGGDFEKLDHAIAEVNAAAYDAALSVLKAILPDNPGFTVEDATKWENRLGLITNEAVSFEDRKLAIIRKMNHPGEIPARQSDDYLQQQLQAAGFNVYVHRNNADMTIGSVIAIAAGIAICGTAVCGTAICGSEFSAFSEWFYEEQCGTAICGTAICGGKYYNNKVVNWIDYVKDIFFNIGANNRSTFFIGGQVFGTFTNVDIERREEFRQLILRLKPVHSVAYLLIDYNY